VLTYGGLCAGHACKSSLLLQFPYYTFIDRSKMYSIGSLFYAIYFFVSFPMFMRLDEQVGGRRWSLRKVRDHHTLGTMLHRLSHH
jgi:hypothetical protein